MEIPRYPHFREIHLEDKNFFKDFLTSSTPEISEYTFTNLFIWHYYSHLLWCLWDECICILAQPESRQPFFLPPLCETHFLERTNALLHHFYNELPALRHSCIPRPDGGFIRTDAIDVRILDFFDYICR